LSAADTGIAHHKFLQHVALAKTTDIPAEATRLLRENFLTPEEHAALDLPTLIAFWDSDLGAKIRTHASAVHRELPFTARFAPATIATIIGGPEDKTLAGEYIVVQGVADLIVLLEKEIWLVDFKTDAVRPKDLSARADLYRPQLQLYAAALESIYPPRRVTLRALYFLTAKKTVKI
jgi:ATP-dependent helicase/nuclease subunit A